MNRYLLVDFEKNCILNLNKVETDFEINEIQTSSTSCINDIETLSTLLEQLKEQIKVCAEKHDIRVCSECNKLMDEGFIDSDFHYYCSDKCLHKHYKPFEWEKLCNDYPDDFYWTAWR